MIISLSFLTLTLHSVLIGKQGNGIANISVCSAGFTVVRNDQLLTEAGKTWKCWLLKYTDLLEQGEHE